MICVLVAAWFYLTYVGAYFQRIRKAPVRSPCVGVSLFPIDLMHLLFLLYYFFGGWFLHRFTRSTTLIVCFSFCTSVRISLILLVNPSILSPVFTRRRWFRLVYRRSIRWTRSRVVRRFRSSLLLVCLTTKYVIICLYPIIFYLLSILSVSSHADPLLLFLWIDRCADCASGWSREEERQGGARRAWGQLCHCVCCYGCTY